MGWWSSLKKAVKKVVRVIKTVVRVVVKIVVGIVVRVINTLLYLLPFNKKMKIQVFILRNLDNVPVINETDIAPAIERAKQIFSDKFGVDIKAYGNPIVQTLPKPAPAAALDVECDAGAFSNEFGEAGEYFARNLAGWNVIPISLSFPVTVFVVDSIKDKIGCSIPITDYVTLSPAGARNDTTLAHELAHTCLLAHRDNPKNLLFPSIPRGTDVTGWQRFVARTSRHCTFW